VFIGLLTSLLRELYNKFHAYLAEIFRKTWPDLEVIRFWWWSGSASGFWIQDRNHHMTNIYFFSGFVHRVAAPYLFTWA